MEGPLNCWHFFLSRHGDKVAGVIGGVLNNSECGVGLAYNVRLGGRYAYITY